MLKGLAFCVGCQSFCPLRDVVVLRTRANPNYIIKDLTLTSLFVSVMHITSSFPIETARLLMYTFQQDCIIFKLGHKTSSFTLLT